MPKQAVEPVIAHSPGNEAFRKQLTGNVEAPVNCYGLTPYRNRTLSRRDDPLQARGLDARKSKTAHRLRS